MNKTKRESSCTWLPGCPYVVELHLPNMARHSTGLLKPQEWRSMVKADSTCQPFLASEFALIGQVLQFLRFLEKTLDEPLEKRRSKSLEDSNLQWSYASTKVLKYSPSISTTWWTFHSQQQIRILIPSNWDSTLTKCIDLTGGRERFILCYLGKARVKLSGWDNLGFWK